MYLNCLCRDFRLGPPSLPWAPSAEQYALRMDFLYHVRREPSAQPVRSEIVKFMDGGVECIAQELEMFAGSQGLEVDVSESRQHIVLSRTGERPP